MGNMSTIRTASHSLGSLGAVTGAERDGVVTTARDLAPLRKFVAGTVDQICVLTSDLDEAAKQWAFLGGDEWRVWTYNAATVPTLTFRGKPADFSMELALSASSPQIELVRPLSGPSIYDDWPTHGKGAVHHVGCIVADLASVVDQLESAGYEVVQSGKGYGASGDGAFAYLDTVDELGVYFELIESPATRRSPDRIISLSAS